MRFELIGLLFIALCFSTEAFSTSPALPQPVLNPAGQTQGDKNGERNKVNQSGPSLKTEVCCFSLEGKKPWEVLRIDDLDTVLTPSGQRLIPLLRVLKALQMEVEEKEGRISFGPAGPARIVLDTQTKQLEINGQTKSVTIVVGVSDITSHRDVYLPPDVLSELLLMKIEWNEQAYGFIAATDQKLSIWKIVPGASLLAIQTKETAVNLPELFPPARPPNFSLDFVELQFRPYFTTATSDSGSSQRFAIDAPKQTFWGNGFGGRYRLQFTEPWFAWDNAAGYQKGDSAPIMLNRGDWTYSLPDAEIAAGDSVFGLNDLTFPIVKLTGVRLNGLSGFPGDENQWRITPGMVDYFINPEVFEGTAPVGSKVELIINDRSIETQAVSVGTYRFEEVRLTPGGLNVVRIIITEPSGFQRVIEKSIFGRSIHLPKGAFAYLGGMGTNRQVYDWSTRGFFGGGRALYGVTDSLTMGTTWAMQEKFYLPVDTSSLEPGERGYPDSSVHWGAQAAWLPREYLFLGGDVSLSSGSGGEGSFNGLAYKFKGELYPSPRLQVLSQFFHYGRDFFNGENRKLRDKEGYAVNGRWIINPKWSLTSTLGGVWNNVDGGSDNALAVDFQNFEITSKLIPRMTIGLGASRIAPSWETGGPKTLYTLRLMATPFKDVYLDGFFSMGDYLDPGQQTDFFTGLRIPGFSSYLPPTAAVSLRVPLNATNSVGATYWQSPGRDRPSISHSYMGAGKPIQTYTELGWDMVYQKVFVQSRIDYLLDRLGKKRIGLDMRLDQGHWTVSLLFTFTDLFSYNRGTPVYVSDSAVTPERAGVHGRVFIDCNANGKLDPGEPGVENIRVIADNVTNATTDKNGYFLLPAIGQNKTSRLFLDIDTVPAIYSPTHAMQTATLRPGSLTEINFGVTPLHSISGLVQMLAPDKTLQPAKGVRVTLINATDEKKVSDSVTAQDGSYYIGDVRPGKYYVEIDPETLPPKYVITGHKRLVELAPKKEPQELNIPPFRASVPATGADNVPG